MNVMVNGKLSPEWKSWLRTNMDAGCDKDGLFKILLDNGFDYQVVRREMKYEPSLPIYMLRNPLKDPQRVENAASGQPCEALDWSELFIANATTVTTRANCALRKLDAFLTDAECRELRNLLKQALPGHPRSESASYGISNVNRLPDQFDLLKGTAKRIERMIGVHPSYADDLGVLIIAGDSVERTIPTNPKRNLDFTLVICLNSSAADLAMIDGEDRVSPQAGTLYVWQYAAGKDVGSLNRKIIKESGEGESVFLYRHFYRDSTEKPAPARHTKEANEYIRNYTEVGFVKTRLSNDLFKKITDFYHQNRKLQDKETIEGGYVYNQADRKRQSSVLVHLSESLKKEIHDTVLPEVAAWCGKELEPSHVYGIRVYKDKAVLKPHRDRIETHILGVIINVDQEVREDWPLIIDDHSYREHKILLQPGDMVFYESARLRHGRPIAFNGDSFANIFCHLRPVDYVLRR